MIELADWQVFALPPLHAAVVGNPQAAVVAANNLFRIRWVDPDIVPVAVRTPAGFREALAAIFRGDKRKIHLEKPIRIGRIDYKPREIERAPNHIAAAVALGPGRTAVVGDVERRAHILDKGINARRV